MITDPSSTCDGSVENVTSVFLNTTVITRQRARSKVLFWDPSLGVSTAPTQSVGKYFSVETLL